MSRRTYEGPPLDGTVQHFAERPYGDDDGETVDVVDADGDAGEESTENVPIPEESDQPRPDDETADRDHPDAEGQTTWDDWGWSA